MTLHTLPQSLGKMAMKPKTEKRQSQGTSFSQASMNGGNGDKTVTYRGQEVPDRLAASVFIRERSIIWVHLNQGLSMISSFC